VQSVLLNLYKHTFICEIILNINIYLQEYGHRVRLATHANFKTFVRSAGVNFYPLGGDPRVLAGCKRFLLNSFVNI
jgi:hypothetical protein